VVVTLARSQWSSAYHFDVTNADGNSNPCHPEATMRYLSSSLQMQRGSLPRDLYLQIGNEWCRWQWRWHGFHLLHQPESNVSSALPCHSGRHLACSDAVNTRKTTWLLLQWKGPERHCGGSGHRKHRQGRFPRNFMPQSSLKLKRWACERKQQHQPFKC
jgi:hypothetical protein